MNTVLAFLGGIGGGEVLIIMMIVLIFFGAKKIPEIARGLGKGLREFQDATRDIKKDLDEGLK